jgi:8-hydroxy-5-deazaflavin:NADPH oxidoreductase
MRIGILGTGVVGTTLGTKLVQLGHDVRMGSRSSGGEKARGWVKQVGGKSSEGTFEEAASHAEVIFNCTSGLGSVEALNAASARNLDGKILIDVANPLDFSRGMPPTLSVCNTDSLGEQIQRAFPGARVVKALNTVTATVMVDPSLVPGAHDLFISGNDQAAKAQVTQILTEWFGWKNVIDLGDITGARAQEMYLPLWLRMYMTFDTPNVNIHVAR